MIYHEGHYPVICPCCKAQFFFPSGEKIIDPFQLEIPKLEELREAHPEVSDEEEQCEDTNKNT